MSLIDFGKGPGKKPVERANMPIEAAQPAPQLRTLVDSAKQQRARLARIAESNWLDLEAQLEQAPAEVAEWRRRAEVAESENERLLDREAAAYRRADNDKARYRDALAAAMAAFTAAAPIMLYAHRKISAAMGTPTKIDMPALAEQLKAGYPLPSVVQQGPASQS
jgi:predicted RNase H-like nuclease (RuvC/YqgF family)